MQRIFYSTRYVIAAIVLITVVFGLFVSIALAQEVDPDPISEGIGGFVRCGRELYPQDSDKVDKEGKSMAGKLKNPCDFNAIVDVAQNIVNWLVFISVLVGAALFAYAGLLYVSSAGSEEKVKKAHDLFRSVLVGFLLVLAAWLIVYTISTAVIKEDKLDILLLDSGN